ncbi:hypothetical protein [Nocardioides sp.]|uniref:hypothetical protein n=1 Tax=Nocardioides sp. TaxID=35761 RepID=UPI003D12A8B5
MTVCEPSGSVHGVDGPCPDGWRRGDSTVPDPWVALSARPWLSLLYADIPEPARYYDQERCIVLRRGLPGPAQRRYLWHELVHADRRDLAQHGERRVECLVERLAVRWALPLSSLTWALRRECEAHDVAGLLQLPEDWVRFRLAVARPGERAVLRRAGARRRVGVA